MSGATAPAWSPREDRTLWTWLAAGLALPVLAWAVGAAFWVHGVGAVPYRSTHPLTWWVVQPLIAVSLVARRERPFQAGVALGAAIGLVLIATLLQAPSAFVAVGDPGQGLEGMTYLRLAVHYAFAVATGAAYVGLAAYVLRRSLSASPPG